jgi:Zn-dependent M28 family amino/carboxypeptidase
MTTRTLAIGFLIGGVFAAAGATKSVDPQIKAMVDSVSQERIAATLKKLESFGTRNIHTDVESDTHGVIAARKWIAGELKSYSPKLEVRFDSYHVRKQGRVLKDLELVNVIAVLPGTLDKDRQYIVSGHYDSITLPKGRNEDSPPVPRPQTLESAKVDSPSPGVTDDGSGTAAVMELARVMSQHEFENTIVFIAFAGEEEGLVGSRLYAEKARAANVAIECVLNNDIIGSDISGNGFSDNGHVRVFSEDPSDSQSRQVARYIREVGERYLPAMRVDMIFRADRFGRGGDHTPFNQQGYAAVRITTPSENYANQHTATDTFANTSVPYITRVAKINLAAMASLANAPKSPIVDKMTTRPDGTKVLAPQITRGKSRYDAVLKWTDDPPAPDLAGYIVVQRSTTAPDWERETFVGKVNEFTLENVSIDDVVFGVKAVDNDGHESLVSAYIMKPSAARKVEVN